MNDSSERLMFGLLSLILANVQEPVWLQATFGVIAVAWFVLFAVSQHVEHQARKYGRKKKALAEILHGADPRRLREGDRR